MKAQKESGSIALHNMNLGARRGYLISAISLPLYLQERVTLPLVQAADLNAWSACTSMSIRNACVHRISKTDPSGLWLVAKPTTLLWALQVREDVIS